MDQYYYCPCGFKCVEGQLAKSGGNCPRCNKGTTAMKAKYQVS